MKDKKSISKQQHLGEKHIVSVILLPLRPASLMHENPQRRKNNSWHASAKIDQSICTCVSAADIMAVVQRCVFS